MVYDVWTKNCRLKFLYYEYGYCNPNLIYTVIARHFKTNPGVFFKIYLETLEMPNILDTK